MVFNRQTQTCCPTMVTFLQQCSSGGWKKGGYQPQNNFLPGMPIRKKYTCKWIQWSYRVCNWPFFFPPSRRPLHVTSCFTLHQHQSWHAESSKPFYIENRMHDSGGFRMYVLTQKKITHKNITSNSNLYNSRQNCQRVGCKAFKWWNWSTPCVL